MEIVESSNFCVLFFYIIRFFFFRTHLIKNHNQMKFSWQCLNYTRIIFSLKKNFFLQVKMWNSCLTSIIYSDDEYWKNKFFLRRKKRNNSRKTLKPSKFQTKLKKIHVICQKLFEFSYIILWFFFFKFYLLFQLVRMLKFEFMMMQILTWIHDDLYVWRVDLVNVVFMHDILYWPRWLS